MRLLKIILFICVIAFSTSSLIAQTVYTTQTGEKYHKASCRYLKQSKIEIQFDKVKALGYTACSVCKPTHDNTTSKPNNFSSNLKSTSKPTSSASKNVQTTQCTGKTKKGTRCKRMTKNKNGRCYQH